ncbi:MAG: hypothetical protein SGPRY_005232 [Prymnesium sp.]
MRADSPSLTVQGLRYTLSPRILGSGGFATVYQAVAPSGVLVAVKIVDRSRHAESVLSQLQNERQALALAQTHPCIVKFYGAARQGSLEVFVMEAVTGGDLLDRVLERQGLPELEAQIIIRQLVMALRWLHDRRIVHGCEIMHPPPPPPAPHARAHSPLPYSPPPFHHFLMPQHSFRFGRKGRILSRPSLGPRSDVKPENILCVSPDSCRVKLADFGLASVLPAGESAVARPKLVGSALYAAPEHTSTFATDMWATGITTYVLLSGKFPFGSTADARTLNPSFYADCWKKLSDRGPEFISQLLIVNHELRLTAAEALSHPWLTPHATSSLTQCQHTKRQKHERPAANDVPPKRQSLAPFHSNADMSLAVR